MIIKAEVIIIINLLCIKFSSILNSKKLKGCGHIKLSVYDAVALRLCVLYLAFVNNENGS